MQPIDVLRSGTVIQIPKAQQKTNEQVEQRALATSIMTSRCVCR